MYLLVYPGRKKVPETGKRYYFLFLSVWITHRPQMILPKEEKREKKVIYLKLA